MIKISITDAKRKLSKVRIQACVNQEILILTSRSNPKAILISLESFQQILGINRSTELASEQGIRHAFRQELEEAITRAWKIS